MTSRTSHIAARSFGKAENRADVENCDCYPSDFKSADDRISQLVADRDALTASIRDLAIEHDVLGRQIKTRSSIISERKNSLTARLKDAANETAKASGYEEAHAKAQKKYESIGNKVASLKQQLELLYNEIAETTSHTLSTNQMDSTRLERCVRLLQESVMRRKSEIENVKAQMEELGEQLAELTANEDELNGLRGRLVERSASVEEKRLSELHVLAEPIDSLRYEESVVDEFDSDVRALEERFNRMNVRSDGYQDDDDEVESTEAVNAQRRAMLSVRREALNQQKREIEAKESLEVKKARRVSLNSTDKVETEKAQVVLDEMAEKLSKRQAEIEKAEEDIARLVAENQIVRQQMTSEWTEKTRVIHALNTQLKEIDELTASIMETNEQVDVSKESIRLAEQRIAQLKRRIDNLQRDKSRNSQTNSLIDRLRENLKKKQDEITAKEAELKERREQLAEEEGQFEELKATADAREALAIDLDDQAKQLEASLEDTLKDLHREKESLDEILKDIPIDRQDQFSDLQELLTAIK